MEIDVQALSLKDAYKLMTGLIAPRPIAMVSTQSAEGLAHIAPYSFFSGVGANPPALLFCPSNDSDGGEKDSLRNAKPKAEGGQGVFAVNLAVEHYAREVAGCAEEAPYGQSEFELTQLQAVACQSIDAPRLAQSPAGFECETLQVIRLAEHQPSGANIVIGKVRHIWIEDTLLDSKRMHIDHAKLQHIGRLGGTGYCSTRDQFELPRGLAALQLPSPFTTE